MSMIQKILCRLGIHKWSDNIGGMRVCLARGCITIDIYYGLTGALRYVREHHSDLLEG